MIQKGAKMDSDRAENDFKEKTLSSLKESLILSLLSMIWIKLTSESFSESEKTNIEKEFISSWKKNISSNIQNELLNINNLLNDENIDMINMIAGSKNIADIEDYQQIINESIKEIEKIFWKMCGK
jgi:hypothetical protein